ncbi:hypothetical protein [Polaromonas sp.]|uniref:hypothetical protein n=1 Tax=Polaromonas sp. TaxID=1869339 RepID=UPI002FCB3DB8
MSPTNPPQNPSALTAGVRPAAAIAPELGPLPGPAINPKAPAEWGKRAHELLQEQIDSINLWANKNRREAKWESFWFWVLKVPVIVASAGYGLMLNLNLNWELALAGAVSAACVLIDGLYRPGNLRNFHHRAYFELRMLADDLSDQWKAALLKFDGDINSVAAFLIEDARKRKAQIAGYLADAEATLGKDAGSPKPKS